MKKITTGYLIGLLLVLLLVIAGCEGVSGPRGETGDQGSQGQSWDPEIPANRYFSLAITNASAADHNGAPKLYLAFDSLHQAAGDTVVCQRLTEGQVPSIDGIDEGAVGWGDRATTVGLLKVAGSDNFIESALVRSAYDESFVYFLVQWSEIENATYGVEVGESNTASLWLKDDTTGADAWQRDSTQEDHVMFMFEVSEVYWFDHDGCYVTCHASTDESNMHRTNLPRQRMDMWIWSAALNQYSGFADDFYLDNSPTLATFWDVGLPGYRENVENVRIGANAYDLPIYQHLTDPNANVGYPLWEWEVDLFELNASWADFSVIPAYINTTPTGSAADVEARGQYSDGTWTVEFKRARATGNGDDAQF